MDMLLPFLIAALVVLALLFRPYRPGGQRPHRARGSKRPKI